MSELPNWLLSEQRLKFRWGSLDEEVGRPGTSAVRFRVGAYLVEEGEYYGLRLRPGVHIGNAALYAATASVIAKSRVVLHTACGGPLPLDAQCYAPHFPLTRAQLDAVEARFKRIDLMELELAAQRTLEPEEIIVAGALAIQAMQEFHLASELE